MRPLTGYRTTLLSEHLRTAYFLIFTFMKNHDFRSRKVPSLAAFLGNDCFKDFFDCLHPRIIGQFTGQTCKVVELIYLFYLWNSPVESTKFPLECFTRDLLEILVGLRPSGFEKILNCIVESSRKKQR